MPTDPLDVPSGRLRVIAPGLQNPPRYGVASTGETIGVPFDHPRDRKALREDERFHELRNVTLDLPEDSFDAMQTAA